MARIPFSGLELRDTDKPGVYAILVHFPSAPIFLANAGKAAAILMKFKNFFPILLIAEDDGIYTYL